jgi:hypothetical protein
VKLLSYVSTVTGHYFLKFLCTAHTPVHILRDPCLCRNHHLVLRRAVLSKKDNEVDIVVPCKIAIELSQVWGYMPIIPATQEPDAGGSQV